MAYKHLKWEFPGGKVEFGETQRDALRREIAEELGCRIEVGQHLLTVEHGYPDFRLVLNAYRCQVASRTVRMTEHVAIRWLAAHELPTLDWAAADWPIVRLLSDSA